MPGVCGDPPGMARRYRSEQAFALDGQVAFHQRGRQGIGGHVQNHHLLAAQCFVRLRALLQVQRRGAGLRGVLQRMHLAFKRAVQLVLA